MIRSNLPLLIPLTYLITAFFVVLFGTWKKHIAYPILMLGAITACAFSSTGLAVVLSEGTMRYTLGGWAPPIGIEYVLDELSSFMLVFISGISLFVLFHSHQSVLFELPDKVVPFYGVSALFLGGLSGIVVTGDLFNLYVFLEITALSGYALVAVGQPKAPIAAFRYLLVGTIGATFYLLGLGYLFLLTGSLNMIDVRNILLLSPHNFAYVVAIVMMVVGFAFKMALFPMHGWLPDAYTYAPSTGTALMAPLGTKVSAYALIRLLFYVFDKNVISSQLHIMDVIAWLSAIGILYGSVLAIAQNDLKRMLAYSSIAQIAYVGLGLSLGNSYGLIGALLHILNHGVMKATLFLVSGNLQFKTGNSTISLLNQSVRKRMPWTSAAFVVAALSMIGIPPTAGFFSKWYLVLGGIEASHWIFVAVILISSLLNAVYFFRVIEAMYLYKGKSNTTETEQPQKAEVPFGMLIPTLVLASFVLLLGLLNVVIVEHVLMPITSKIF